ncbi:MAG: RHS repeat-associated core domain-containing protein [Spirochaetota bacterium]
MRAWMHTSIGRRPGRKFDIHVISVLWLGFRVRKVAKRVVGSETRQVEVLYPSMYFGLEKQRDSAGAEVPNSVYSVNNIYLDGVRIAAVIPSGDARYYLTDQVDSVKVVADDNGLAVSRMEYMPYGETWFEEGDTNNAPKYNSQELDTESNLYYYNARHYSQDVARFVTPDTMIPNPLDTQSWNRYSYCSNNPIIYKDPTGHAPLSDFSSEALTDAWANSGFDTPREKAKEPSKPTMSKEENDATIAKLENKIVNAKASGSDRIDLNKGLHIVMLENNNEGFKRGKDEIKGDYYIIKDGNILKTNPGTSKSSITPMKDSKEDFDTAVNADNNLKPGNYKFKGDLKEGQMELYENDTKMKAKDRTMPSTGGKYNTQDKLLIHDIAKSQTWSGSIGCQALAGFKGWAQEYSKKNESKVTGDYHLIDMITTKKED